MPLFRFWGWLREVALSRLIFRVLRKAAYRTSVVVRVHNVVVGIRTLLYFCSEIIGDLLFYCCNLHLGSLICDVPYRTSSVVAHLLRGGGLIWWGVVAALCHGLALWVFELRLY